MEIERISLEDLSVSPFSGAHVATVLLYTGMDLLSVRASALPPEPPDGTSAMEVVARALVQDALRQLRRMPEYRTGTKVITITDTAWPCPSERA